VCSNGDHTLEIVEKRSKQGSKAVVNNFWKLLETSLSPPLGFPKDVLKTTCQRFIKQEFCKIGKSQHYFPMVSQTLNFGKHMF
jgi:hypothetical protein